MPAVATLTRPDRTYEIHEVAVLTGLAPARLRAWERRYEVVRPRRLSNGYRVYTADQVALLRAYARLIAAGERVGDLAGCEREDVLARAEVRPLDGSPQAALLEAVRAFDRERLEGLVAQQLALRGLRAFAEEVVLPAGAIGGRSLGARPSSHRRRAPGERGGAPRAQGRPPDVAGHRTAGGGRVPVGRAPRVGLPGDARDAAGGRMAHPLSRRRPAGRRGGRGGVEAVAGGRGVQRQRSLDRARQPARPRGGGREAPAATPWPSSAVAGSSPTPACSAATD